MLTDSGYRIFAFYEYNSSRLEAQQYRDGWTRESADHWFWVISLAGIGLTIDYLMGRDFTLHVSGSD